MGPKDKIRVTILVMDRHFLYLPVYLAQFDHPESGKLPFFGKVPPQYSVEVTLPQRTSDRTDAAVFDALMDARLGSSDIMFAVCDPTVLLGRQDKNALMAASLISSSAFWAVNHNAQNVRLVSDLSSFDRIICYGEKTTSNLIARRIVKRDTNKLIVVNSTDEIERLENLGEGTLAISPELLKIANLIHGPHRPGEKRAEIVLELCTTKEFSNVLTTALFTRAEVVETHPELVSGVLAALQSALLAIHAGHPMVAECARHSYTDTFCLDEALAIAIRGNVFPETIQVRRDRWQRACEFYYISHAMAAGQDKSKLTKFEELKAEEIYQQAVLDPRLKRLVAKAITSGFLVALDDENRASADRATRLSRQVVVWALLLVAGFGGGVVFSAPVAASSQIAMGASWAMMLLAGWWTGNLVGYRKPSLGYAVHWVSFVLSWWALHEIFIRRILPNAYFLVGVELGDVGAGALLALGLAIGTAVGVYIRSESSKEAKKAKKAKKATRADEL
jgi:hypothetical protein